MKTTRRKFIRQSGLTLAATAFINPLLASGFTTKNLSIGFQVWTIRKKLIADFSATLEEMKMLGYSEIEMCSPLGYSMAGFAPLNKMTGAEMKQIVTDSGLSCTSSHFTMGELRDSLDNRIEWAQELGMKQMILSTFWLPKSSTVDDYRRAAGELNIIAEKTRSAGIQMGFHNHHMEFEEIDGELIYDALLDEFDPDLVKMQFQVAVVNIGYRAADYFRKYKGRFISAHLADWSAEQEESVAVGQGIVDWDDFFVSAKEAGVKNFFVELDPELFKDSADYLLKR